MTTQEILSKLVAGEISAEQAADMLPKTQEIIVCLDLRGRLLLGLVVAAVIAALVIQ